MLCDSRTAPLVAEAANQWVNVAILLDITGIQHWCMDERIFPGYWSRTVDIQKHYSFGDLKQQSFYLTIQEAKIPNSIHVAKTQSVENGILCSSKEA